MVPDDNSERAAIQRAYFSHGVYILRPDELLVSVFSQQVRALKLVRALYHQQPRPRIDKGTRVSIIGGGAAGLTAAAAAALVGAEVTLFEQSRALMPLQIGCYTRALHPHIHQWPDDAAFRAVSQLPILGWTAGTAHEVAQEIVGKFEEIRRFVKPRLKVEHTRAVVQPGKGESRPCVFWDGDKKLCEECDIVIVAVGFGIERTVNNLPLTSYWRVDPLGQPTLASSGQRIIISGAGAGGLIDILRATITEFDHTTFFDDMLLRLRPIQSEIANQEKEVWKEYVKAYTLCASCLDGKIS